MTYKRASKSSRARFQKFLQERRETSRARLARRVDLEKVNKEFQKRCETVLADKITKLEGECGSLAKKFLLSEGKVSELEEKLKRIDERWRKRCENEVNFEKGRVREKVEKVRHEMLEDRAKLIQEKKQVEAGREIVEQQMVRLNRELEEAREKMRDKDLRIRDLARGYRS